MLVRHIETDVPCRQLESTMHLVFKFGDLLGKIYNEPRFLYVLLVDNTPSRNLLVFLISS